MFCVCLVFSVLYVIFSLYNNFVLNVLCLFSVLCPLCYLFSFNPFVFVYVVSYFPTLNVILLCISHLMFNVNFFFFFFHVFCVLCVCSYWSVFFVSILIIGPNFLLFFPPSMFSFVQPSILHLLLYVFRR
uniref:Uncharacterized protein n=1 Tax=Cacopsylla melanoneura TaxID=428564 RepID=A0A8D9E4N1_9HEMI